MSVSQKFFVFAKFLNGKNVDLCHDEMTLRGENVHVALVCAENVSFALECTQTRASKRTAVNTWSLCESVMVKQRSNECYVKCLLSMLHLK